MGTRSFPITQEQARILMDGISALKRQGVEGAKLAEVIRLWDRLTDIGYPKPEPVLLKPMPPILKRLANMSPEEIEVYLKEKEKVRK
jgi:hypothetical protein